MPDTPRMVTNFLSYRYQPVGKTPEAKLQAFFAWREKWIAEKNALSVHLREQPIVYDIVVSSKDAEVFGWLLHAKEIDYCVAEMLPAGTLGLIPRTMEGGKG